jgi:hypothetical protein
MDRRLGKSMNPSPELAKAQILIGLACIAVWLTFCGIIMFLAVRFLNNKDKRGKKN